MVKSEAIISIFIKPQKFGVGLQSFGDNMMLPGDMYFYPHSKAVQNL